MTTIGSLSSTQRKLLENSKNVMYIGHSRFPVNIILTPKILLGCFWSKILLKGEKNDTKHTVQCKIESKLALDLHFLTQSIVFFLNFSMYIIHFTQNYDLSSFSRIN